MEKTELIGKITEFFGEREDVDSLDEVITELNNVYNKVETINKEWKEKYIKRFGEAEPEKEEEIEEARNVTIDDLFTKKEEN